MLARRQHLCRIAHSDPPHRNERPRCKHRVDVHDPVDPHLDSPPEAGAIEDHHARGQEDLVLDGSSTQVRMRPDEHGLTQVGRMLGHAPNDSLLHDDAVRADVHGAALRREDGAEENARVLGNRDLAADCGIGGDVDAWVNRGSVASVFDEHG